MVLFFSVRNKFLKGLFFILWFLFFPNTMYVVTDVEHIIRQWPDVSGVDKLTVFVQYTILEVVGLLAFLIALFPFEKLSQKYMTKEVTVLLIVGYNFLIGFAMILGKVERVHSIDVFLHPLGVVSSMLAVLQSRDLLLLAFFFGLFANFFYFLFRKKFTKVTVFINGKRKK